MKAIFLAVIVAVIGLHGSAKAETTLAAVQLALGTVLPAGCSVVVYDENSQLSNVAAGATISLRAVVTCKDTVLDCTVTVTFGGVGGVGQLLSIASVKLHCPQPIGDISFP